MWKSGTFGMRKVPVVPNNEFMTLDGKSWDYQWLLPTSGWWFQPL
jgi:hypothetical protein